MIAGMQDRYPLWSGLLGGHASPYATACDGGRDRICTCGGNMFGTYYYGWSCERCDRSRHLHPKAKARIDRMRSAAIAKDRCKFPRDRPALY